MIPYVTDTPDITIPDNLLPADGRFGSGPSKVRPAQVSGLLDRKIGLEVGLVSALDDVFCH